MSWTSNFVRPRSVLLALHTIQLFAFGMLLVPKNLRKNLPKRCLNLSKIDTENGLFFNIAFFSFRPRFGTLLGLHAGPMCISWALWGASWPARGLFLNALGVLWGGFWLPGTSRASIWEGLGTCQAGFSKVFGTSYMMFSWMWSLRICISLRCSFTPSGAAVCAQHMEFECV